MWRDPARPEHNTGFIYLAQHENLSHFSRTGRCAFGGGPPTACARRKQRRLGHRRSAGSEACREVAARVQPRLGPKQQPCRLWHVGLPGCRTVRPKCLQVSERAEGGWGVQSVPQLPAALVHVTVNQCYNLKRSEITKINLIL